MPLCLRFLTLPQLSLVEHTSFIFSIFFPHKLALGSQDRGNLLSSQDSSSSVHMLFIFFVFHLWTWASESLSGLPGSPGFMFIGSFLHLVSSLWLPELYADRMGRWSSEVCGHFNGFFRRRWSVVCDFSFSCEEVQSSHGLNHFISF